MRQLDGEQTLMRIFLGESARFERKPLYEVIVETLRREGLAGATVLRGIMGFGASSVLHTDRILRLSGDLPVVIEVVDNHARIEALLPRLDALLQGGMVTLEKVRVLRYAPAGGSR